MERQQGKTYMTPTTCTVDKLPALHRASLWLGDDSVLDIGPRDSIDLPLAIAAHKFVRTVHTRLGRRQWDIAKVCGQGIVVGVVEDGIANHKSHHAVGGNVVIVCSDLAGVFECNVLTSILCEIENDFPSLGHGNVELGGVDRAGKKACIRADDCERDASAFVLVGFCVELERTTDGSVEEAEQILARLNLEVWPWLAVDLDDITKDTGGFAVELRVPKRAIGVVALG